MTFGRPARRRAGAHRAAGDAGGHLAALEKRLVLVDSGVARLSGEIHAAVWAAYARHDDTVTGALLALKQYGHAMRDAIAGSDFGGIKHVLNENWTSRSGCTRASRTTQSTRSSMLAMTQRRDGRQGVRRGRRRRARVLRVVGRRCDDAAPGARRGGVAVIDFAFDFEGLVDDEARP